MSSLYIKNIKSLVTCDDRDSVIENANIYIEDGLIRAIWCDTETNYNTASRTEAGNTDAYEVTSRTEAGYTNAHNTASRTEAGNTDAYEVTSRTEAGYTDDCEVATHTEPNHTEAYHAKISQDEISRADAAHADRVIDATGMLCYPGLINTHHHLYQVFSRNLKQVQNMELFDWLKTLYEIWKNLDSDVIRYSSLTGMGELMKNGCTTCFDHHYVFPADTNDLIGTQFEAADDLGIRMYASRGSMDLSKKDGGLPPDSVVQSVDEIMRDSARLIDKYNDTSYGAMHRIALAPCSPFSVSKDLLRESALLARQYNVRLHTHLCETKDEERYMLEREGVRPLEYMQKLGWTGPDVWYAHGIHFNDDELKLLAETGTGVCHCPISNMKLASGIARVPEMIKMGIPVGLGVDGSASNDGSSLLEEIRVAFLLHRLNSSRKAPSGYDILKLATVGSAKVLGRTDIGSLAPGKCADLFMIDSRRLELVGATYDPTAVLATVGVRGAVDYTVVNGKITVENGHLVTIDEEKTSAIAAGVCDSYLRK